MRAVVFHLALVYTVPPANAGKAAQTPRDPKRGRLMILLYNLEKHVSNSGT